MIGELGNAWLYTAEMYMNSGRLLSMNDKTADYVGKFFNIKFDSINKELDGDKRYEIISKK